MTESLAVLATTGLSQLPGESALHVVGVTAALPEGSVSVAVFFLVGLLGGAHCLGMCGPLVSVYADELGDDRGRGPTTRELRQHALFNTGRTLGYATVGALLGAVGLFVFETAAVLAIAETVRAAAGIIVGVLVLLAGAGYLWRGTAGATPPVPVLGSAFTRVYGFLSGRVHTWARGPRILGLGAVHALLPCPLLYPAFLYVLALGSPVAGAVNLAALGLGTFPTLFAYGAVVGSIAPRWRTHLHRTLGVAFLVLGYVPLSMGLRSAGIAVPMAPLPFYMPLG